ncbi:hypothetical protein [Capnocytophaga sputigena]|uniref:hypothetical protein n=1 Tax=Capnocytophaga sputigena TaxID=1019 RepID=UPI0028D14C4E|nr:hypothetical protein [Capnocytophaga sputigena]
MKRILYFILILFVLPTLHAQEVKVTTSTKNIKIGEQIEYKISVQAPADAAVVFPEGQTFGALEMVKTNPTDTLKEAGKFRLEKAYYLTQFDEGKYTIPQQKIQISHKDFYTDSLLVEVHNVAVDTLKQPLYDAKPIVEVTSPSSSHLWLWIVGIVALLLTAAALYFFVFRKKKLSAEEERKKLPPFERAIQDLKDLQNSKYLIESQHKAYYTRLTDIVKEYLEDEVHILAKESTTDELLAKINDLQQTGKLHLSEETINNLKRVLQNADLVKFAKSKPSDNNAEYDRETIERVVIKTKEAIPIVVADGETPAQDAFVMSVLKIRERKKKRNRIALIASLCFILSTPVLLIGYNLLKNKYFNTYANINRSEWVTSDYGFPITELTTPEVLIRKQIVDITEYKSIIDKQYTFYYGSINSPLYIMTNIITFKKDAQNTAPQQEGQDGGLTLDPKKVNEIVLSQLDKAKAKNITTLTEEYTSPSGAKGMKVFGKMSIPDEKGKYFNASYELYSFTENNALQQVLITYIDETDANKIAQRIINSIVFKTE